MRKLLEIPFAFFLSLLAYSGFGFFLSLAYPYFFITGFRENQVRHFMYLVSRYMMFCVRLSSKSYVIDGAEPPPGSAVIVANHSSILDIVCMSQFGMKDLIFLTGGWPLALPIGGRYLRGGFGLFAEETEDFNALTGKVRAAFEKGLKLVVFPEGTRSTDGRVHRFKSGAFALARDCGVPVIPAALRGLGPALPKGKIWLTSSAIRLTLLEPAPPFEKGDLSAFHMAQYVKRLIVEKLAET